MHYTIYRTTNKLTGKYYIGKHQTTDLEDGYIGSGRALMKAVRKYGKDAFSKEILFVFSTQEEMDAMERSMIDESVVNDPMSYNIGLGGEGGPHFKGKRHKRSTLKKLRIAQTGKSHDDETRRKISEANSRRTLSLETREKIAASRRGTKLSDETRKKISDTLRLKQVELE